MSGNLKEWVNIPGTYLLLSYVCALATVIAAHPRRRSWLRCFCVLLPVVFVMGAALIMNPRARGFRFFLSMGIVWTLFVLTVRMCLDLPWMDASYFAIRCFFIGDLCASLSWQLVYYLMKRFPGAGKLKVTVWVLPAGCLVYFGIVWLIESNMCKDSLELRIQRKDCAMAWLIAVFFYFMANISYVLADSPFSADDLPETYARRTLTEFGAVIVLLAFHVQLIERQTQLRMQAMENLWIRQEENNRIYETSIALVNQKYHDLKHQLHLLKENVDKRQGLEYIDSMERELESYAAQNKTGNPALDTVLTIKNMACIKNEIRFTCVAEGHLLEKMHPLDVSALFGNLLDNAIECEMKIPETDRRRIHLSVSRQKEWISIYSRNTCDEAVAFRDGLPISGKQDSRFHGYGAASIRTIVEKYQGNVIMRQEDGWFETNILIPLLR